MISVHVGAYDYLVPKEIADDLARLRASINGNGGWRAEVKRLERERDEALAQVVTCRRLVERWRDKVPADVWEELSRIPDSARALLTRLERAERVAEALEEHGAHFVSCQEQLETCGLMIAMRAWQEARDDTR